MPKRLSMLRQCGSGTFACRMFAYSWPSFQVGGGTYEYALLQIEHQPVAATARHAWHQTQVGGPLLVTEHAVAMFGNAFQHVAPATAAKTFAARGADLHPCRGGGSDDALARLHHAAHAGAIQHQFERMFSRDLVGDCGGSGGKQFKVDVLVAPAELRGLLPDRGDEGHGTAQIERRGAWQHRQCGGDGG